MAWEFFDLGDHSNKTLGTMNDVTIKNLTDFLTIIVSAISAINNMDTEIPSIDTIRIVNISNEIAASTSDAKTPTLNLGLNISAEVSTLTASTNEPNLSLGLNVISNTANSSTNAEVPILSSGLDISAEISVNTSDAEDPILSTGASIGAEISTSINDAEIPTLNLGLNISAEISVSSVDIPSAVITSILGAPILAAIQQDFNIELTW
ncbi:MAG: hypothetical protein KQ78_01886 [Candidatus Izimaplasma bacterium HR2]|nr:MAG: hypothetical protein KQ78_01886 [Candidatus Izimaplasma bacterium HR2]